LLPSEQIKSVSVVLTFKTHFVVMSTPAGSERIPVASLVDSDGFMDLIEKNYYHVLKEHLDTSKYT
jgi:hypothetical protein